MYLELGAIQLANMSSFDRFLPPWLWPAYKLERPRKVQMCIEIYAYFRKVPERETDSCQSIFGALGPKEALLPSAEHQEQDRKFFKLYMLFYRLADHLQCSTIPALLRGYHQDRI